MRYRAKRACIAGGVFRRAGEVFEHEPYPALPDHLEALDRTDEAEAMADKPTRPGRPAKPKEPGPGLADLGEGVPASVADLTSDQVISPGEAK